MIVPMYNAECAPPEVRGALVGLQQLAITTGIMISFWIDYGTQYIGGVGAGQKDSAWLIPLCLQLAPAVLLGAGMMFMPFSPRWLEHHGREAEARKTLASLRGLSQDHELIELEYMEIRAQSLFEKRTVAEHFPNLADGSASSTIKLQFVAIASLFKSKPMFRRVALATVTMFFQQWTGMSYTRETPHSATHTDFTLLRRYQRDPVLCSTNLQGLGLIEHYRISPCHWCGGNSYVGRHHACRVVRRQSWTKANPYCGRKYTIELELSLRLVLILLDLIRPSAWLPAT